MRKSLILVLTAVGGGAGYAAGITELGRTLRVSDPATWRWHVSSILAEQQKSASRSLAAVGARVNRRLRSAVRALFAAGSSRTPRTIRRRAASASSAGRRVGGFRARRQVARVTKSPRNSPRTPKASCASREAAERNYGKLPVFRGLRRSIPYSGERNSRSGVGNLWQGAGIRRPFRRFWRNAAEKCEVRCFFPC